MWIIQEVVFNLDVTLICGSMDLSWARFCAALNALKTFPTRELFQKVKDIDSMFAIWRSHCMIDRSTTTAHLNILDLLEQFNHYNVTDDRDRIYALHSMATDIQTFDVEADLETQTINMPVDYTKSKFDTYEAFSKACFRAGHGPHLLKAILRRHTSGDYAQLPSWVLNLGVPRDDSITLCRLPVTYLGCQGKRIKLNMEVRSVKHACHRRLSAVRPFFHCRYLGTAIRKFGRR